MNTQNRTLSDIVTERPAAAAIFARHGLDFCCHGQRTLEQACGQANLNPDVVLTELSAAWSEEASPQSWQARPLSELVVHIVERYHASLRRDLPALIALSRTVEQVHAGNPGRPEGLTAHLERIHAAVLSHLRKEEQILFPLITANRGDTAHMPIKVIMQEHEDHGANLRRIRELTNDLSAPPEACASWRELYRGLAALEADLWRHIHLENYVLFPRALEAR